jgi:hypothetical protein
MLVGRIFRTLGMGLVRRDPRRYGAFFCFTPQCPIAQKCDGVGLHESTSQATQKELTSQT